MTTHVLILCTHNSARSVLSEGMLNHLAQQLGVDVRAHSAGSAPSGRINPFAIEALQHAGVDTSAYRSKSWDEFTTPDAPPLSIVITVCDSAAAEACPVFFGGQGQPVKVHWGYPDPSNAEGGDEGGNGDEPADVDVAVIRRFPGHIRLAGLPARCAAAWKGTGRLLISEG